MEDYSKEKKHEDVKHPFESLDKIQVLQEARIFGETRPKAKKCVYLISKVLYLLGQGVKLRKDEATGLFVKCTMLFGIKHKKLRRMLYLILKELSHTAEQTFIACSSLSSDMTRDQKKFPFKANVIRTLRSISDVQTFMSMERHFVESIVDQDQSVSSSALISGLLFSKENIDMVKRWTQQIYSAMKSRFQMPQYHALAFMYKLQHRDPLSVSKLILNQSSQFRSPLAHCLLIKYSSYVLQRERNEEGETSKKILNFLDSCLGFKNEMIVLEAVRVLTSLDFLSEKHIEKAIQTMLTILLVSESSNKSITTFGCVRILHRLAEKYPKLVYTCADSLEKLIQHPNKNISTLAISTLLKCSNSDMDMVHLTEEIHSFIIDISDEYKINVINSIKTLIPRSPKHHMPILKFLEKIYNKIDGAFLVKNAIVQTIIAIIEANEKVLTKGMHILCEFIEDCEFDVLLQEVIHYLGKYGPKLKNPNMCIRYIYNRVFLEHPSVRAAAVDSLYLFGKAVPELRESIISILRRILTDPNDDVRDRVILCMRSLEGDFEIFSSVNVDFETLEHNLMEYVNNAELHEQTFDHHNMKPLEKPKPDEEDEGKDILEEAVQSVENDTAIFFTICQKIPQLKELGKPLKTCNEVLLTEEEGDYIVRCIKHIYAKNIVLQFNCTNNVENQKLVNVGIEVDVEGIDGMTTAFGMQANSIAYGETEPILVILNVDTKKYPCGLCSSNLTFKIHEDDCDEEDYEEGEYELEDLKFSMKDYMVKFNNPKFKETWEKLSDKNEAVKRKELPKGSTLKSTIDTIINYVGVDPVNEIGRFLEKKTQSLYFSLKLLDGEEILIATKALEDKNKRCKFVIYVRNLKKEIRELIINKLF